MQSNNKNDLSHIIEVEFNQQQEVVLKQLLEDGKYGNDYSEVIRNIFQEFLRQTRI